MKINFTNLTNYDLDMYNAFIKKAIKKDKQKGIISIIYCTPEEIKDINNRYRNIDKVTDVISFALHESDIAPHAEAELGDIFICYDKAVEQAYEYGHAIARELTFLAIHGYLHLLGYDHQTKEDEAKMIEKQKALLAKVHLEKR